MRTRLRWVVLALVALVGGLWLPLAPWAPMEPVAAAPTSNGSTWWTATINLPNGAIGYDKARDRVLVAVAPTVPALGNHLVELNPHTGALGRSIFVGADPTVIAVADDASRAYVGLSGAPSITEVDLATFTVTRRITLGHGAVAATPQDIAVQPGHPGVIAVVGPSVCCSGVQDLVIYDNGVARPQTAGMAPARLTWSADPGVLYGLTSITGIGAATILVTADGALLGAGHGLPLAGNDLEFGDGLLHSSNGNVVDPATWKVVGQYPVPASDGVLAVDAAQHKVFVLAGSGNAATIQRFDIATKASDWSRAVPNISPVSLVDAGTAMAAASPGQILLLGPGVSGSAFVLPAGPASVVQPWHAKTTPLTLARLIASPDQAHLYGVAAANAATHANELVEIDPADGSVGRSLVVGGDPNALAVSRDGSTLMVGRQGTNVLTEVDVSTFTALGNTLLAATERPISIAARPGAPHDFAVQIHDGFDGPTSILVHDQVIAANRAASIGAATFGDDPTVLYAVRGGGLGNDLVELAVDVDGVTPTRTSLGVLETDTYQLVPSGGLLYAGRGVVDPAVPIEVGSVRGFGLGVPDSARNRLFTVAIGLVGEFTLDTYTAVSSSAVPEAGYPVDAVLVGSTVAIATTTSLELVPLGPDDRTAPGPPTGVIGTPGLGLADVSWTPPVNTGFAPITSYHVVASPGGASCDSATTSCTVTGLTNGTLYTFTVTATNLKGTGPGSAPSAGTIPVGPPAAPINFVGVAGDGTATFTWEAASDGGSPITQFNVTEVQGDSGRNCTTYGAANTTCTVTGLRNGGFYTFQVKAWNAAGYFSQQSASVLVIPTRCDGSGPGPYPDVSATHPFCQEIEWATGYWITTGYADGTFRGTNPLTRQALAAYVYRFASNGPPAKPAQPTFSDVGFDHPFSLPIEWMAYYHLVDGFPDGTYRPTTVVSRQALAAILYRLAGAPSFHTPTTPTFSDVPATHPFFTEIEWLASTGIAHGYPDGTFRATDPVSRQASTAFLRRFFVWSFS